jgi:hypothetical protein
MSQLLLGLGNRARHGKDSFAQAIIRYYGNLDAAKAKHGLAFKPTIIQHIAFADALYKEVNAWLATKDGSRWRDGFKVGVESSRGGILIPDRVTPDNPLTDPRAPLGKYTKLLQWWGTEYRRDNFGQNYWVEQWKAAVNPKADIVFTTDMRFRNEAAAVKELGGFTVQVNRLNVDGTPFVDTSRDPNHPSETQLDGHNYDFKITIKTGDLVLLEDWAVTLVHYLRALKGK